eukprot:UN2121
MGYDNSCGWWGKGGAAMQMPMQALPPQNSNGPFDGVVKSIAPKGGKGGDHTYGFVECEETRNIYGRDAFLHSNQATELEVGVRVRFEVGLNQRGMPQAHNIMRLS